MKRKSGIETYIPLCKKKKRKVQGEWEETDNYYVNEYLLSRADVHEEKGANSLYNRTLERKTPPMQRLRTSYDKVERSLQKYVKRRIDKRRKLNYQPASPQPLPSFKKHRNHLQRTLNYRSPSLYFIYKEEECFSGEKVNEQKLSSYLLYADAIEASSDLLFPPPHHLPSQPSDRESVRFSSLFITLSHLNSLHHQRLSLQLKDIPNHSDDDNNNNQVGGYDDEGMKVDEGEDDLRKKGEFNYQITNLFIDELSYRYAFDSYLGEEGYEDLKIFKFPKLLEISEVIRAAVNHSYPSSYLYHHCDYLRARRKIALQYSGKQLCASHILPHDNNQTSHIDNNDNYDEVEDDNVESNEDEDEDEDDGIIHIEDDDDDDDGGGDLKSRDWGLFEGDESSEEIEDERKRQEHEVISPFQVLSEKSSIFDLNRLVLFSMIGELKTFLWKLIKLSLLLNHSRSLTSKSKKNFILIEQSDVENAVAFMKEMEKPRIEAKNTKSDILETLFSSLPRRVPPTSSHQIDIDDGNGDDENVITDDIDGNLPDHDDGGASLPVLSPSISDNEICFDDDDD